MVCDVTKNDDIKNFFQFSKDKLGTIDILVNNAAFGEIKIVEEMNVEDIEKTIQSCLTGVIICTKHAIEIMKDQKNGGHIVMVDAIGLFTLKKRIKSFFQTTWVYNYRKCKIRFNIF
jgi:NAD(P)-dependent dehydrogenase (short-subunit alcohol dehydrogenase family)